MSKRRGGSEVSGPTADVDVQSQRFSFSGVLVVPRCALRRVFRFLQVCSPKPPFLSTHLCQLAIFCSTFDKPEDLKGCFFRVSFGFTSSVAVLNVCHNVCFQNETQDSINIHHLDSFIQL